MKALIFDCDGVLVDTERDGHRVAFNRAFELQGIGTHWDTAQYGQLLTIAGGKERMRYYFDQHGWPVQVIDKDALIRELHYLKTTLFMQIIEAGELPLRSGVARLVDEAIDSGITLAVCSTSNERAVNLVVKNLLGAERKKHFRAIFAGDVVSEKKPSPAIYLKVRDQFQHTGADYVVVEDSRNGLLAAKGADMRCLITKSSYTAHEDFSEADLVVNELGDPPGFHITLKDLSQLARC